MGDEARAVWGTIGRENGCGTRSRGFQALGNPDFDWCEAVDSSVKGML